MRVTGKLSPLENPTTASGSLATFVSFTILPLASTMQHARQFRRHVNSRMLFHTRPPFAVGAESTSHPVSHPIGGHHRSVGAGPITASNTIISEQCALRPPRRLATRRMPFWQPPTPALGRRERRPSGDLSTSFDIAGLAS